MHSGNSYKVVYKNGRFKEHHNVTLIEAQTGSLYVYNLNGDLVRVYGPSYEYYEPINQ